MSHPFQCLLYCPQPEAGILVAASGPYIHTFNARQGILLSSWPSHQGVESPKDFKNHTIVESKTYESYERPLKRQKFSSVEDDSDGTSVEIVVDDEDGDSTKTAANPPIIKLAGTSNGSFVVAVTGEDKCIRVFELSQDGELKQLSERPMPKRPCAIILTPDDSTILCADKFGDVYSLPLMGELNEDITKSISIDGDLNDKINGSHRKPFVPSANSLTVHTKRNQEALRQQQKIKKPKVEKKALNFDYRLLLGHVSLLTDIACVSLPSPSRKPREYILTSDRDEHIRISRGIPQAHVIEAYCLGHTEFISKLCVIPAHPQLLLSGGGDDYLTLWDWPSGSIRQKIDLRGHVEDIRRKYNMKMISTKASMGIQDNKHVEEDSAGRITVSNIQTLEATEASVSDLLRTIIVVTCEGIPALFVFTTIGQCEVQFNETIIPKGNIVDMVVLQNQSLIVYSMDTVHEAFSTSIVADNEAQKSRPSIGTLTLDQVTLHWKHNAEPYNELINTMEQCGKRHRIVSHKGAAKGKYLKDLIYGLGSLRKRTGEGSESRNTV